MLPLLQETLVLLWGKVERRFLPLRAYEALVLTRSAYGGPCAEGAGWGECTGLQVAMARRAEAALEALPEKYRTMLVLREYEGLSYEEIADVCGIMPAAARKQASRAFATMRQRLGDLPAP